MQPDVTFVPAPSLSPCQVQYSVREDTPSLSGLEHKQKIMGMNDQRRFWAKGFGKESTNSWSTVIGVPDRNRNGTGAITGSRDLGKLRAIRSGGTHRERSHMSRSTKRIRSLTSKERGHLPGIESLNMEKDP